MNSWSPDICKWTRNKTIKFLCHSEPRQPIFNRDETESQRQSTITITNTNFSAERSILRTCLLHKFSHTWVSEWVSEQCFTSPPTQYRLYGRRFLQVKRPNQQYQSTEGRSTKEKENNENNQIHIYIDNNDTQNDIHKISTASPLVYNNMGWLGDGYHRGQGR